MVCRRDHNQSVIYGAMKNVLPDSSSSPFATMPTVSPVNSAALAEYQRLQLYDYAQVAAARSLRFTGHPAFSIPSPYGLTAAFPSLADGTAGLSAYGFTSPFVRFDPRARFVQEEPKPQHSYIGLIAMAILSSPDKKMVLSDIYQYILDQYPYFRNRGPGWRNSIRHNLSLNDCFIKAGRSANGKGHYWAIHPANIEDFKKGDFRRRKAQRKVRKHMGLSVPDDDDSPTPTPPPPPPPQHPTQPSIMHHQVNPNHHDISMVLCQGRTQHKALQNALLTSHPYSPGKLSVYPISNRQKRQFDMESLLAPDPVRSQSPKIEPCAFSSSIHQQNYLTAATASSAPTDVDEAHSPVIESPSSRGSPGEIKEDDHQSCHDPNNVMDKDLLTTPRPVLPTTANLAMRRAMQWTMSLPLQTTSQQPSRVPFNIAFGTPCWTSQQIPPNSFMTYSGTSASSQLRPTDLTAIPCGSPNPLIHRWQETLHRLDQENGHKPIEQ